MKTYRLTLDPDNRIIPNTDVVIHGDISIYFDINRDNDSKESFLTWNLGFYSRDRKKEWDSVINDWMKFQILFEYDPQDVDLLEEYSTLEYLSPTNENPKPFDFTLIGKEFLAAGISTVNPNLGSAAKAAMRQIPTKSEKGPSWHMKRFYKEADAKEKVIFGVEWNIDTKLTTDIGSKFSGRLGFKVIGFKDEQDVRINPRGKIILSVDSPDGGKKGELKDIERMIL